MSRGAAPRSLAGHRPRCAGASGWTKPGVVTTLSRAQPLGTFRRRPSWVIDCVESSPAAPRAPRSCRGPAEQQTGDRRDEDQERRGGDVVVRRGAPDESRRCARHAHGWPVGVEVAGRRRRGRSRRRLRLRRLRRDVPRGGRDVARGRASAWTGVAGVMGAGVMLGALTTFRTAGSAPLRRAACGLRGFRGSRSAGTAPAATSSQVGRRARRVGHERGAASRRGLGRGRRSTQQRLDGERRGRTRARPVAQSRGSSGSSGISRAGSFPA